MHAPFRLSVFHPDADHCDAFRRRLDGLPSVDVLQTDLAGLPPHDCLATAGNAYGIMTAGIDAAVVGLLGEPIMKSVRHHIMDAHLGQQPIGTAFLLPTRHADFPRLCHAPTMRTPGNIEGTDHVHAAAWAAVLSVVNHNAARPAERIESLAMPSLGTGYGGVPPDESARQIAAAWRAALTPPHRLDWDWVISREKLITEDGGKRVVRRP